jgi:glycosyltransferase involved in cell wall biosynthesis
MKSAKAPLPPEPRFSKETAAAMTEPVRVTLVLASLHGGGAERVAAHLVNRCDPARVDVRMALLRRSGPFLAEADASRIDVAPIGSRYLEFEGHNSGFYRPDKLAAAAVLAPLNVSRMIRDHRAQVVMSFLKGISLLTWRVVAGVKPKPVWICREGNNTDVVIEDELANPFARNVVKGLTRRAYRAADIFLANSHEMARGLTERLDLNPGRVRVIQNPIDVGKVSRLSREPLAAPHPRDYIVTAGRLEYQKGHDILLKAFAASRAARGLDLIILGRGSIEADLKRQAAELGVADRVFFPGFVENPWQWIARSCLFVLPSRWEGFPSIVAETLACGVPALATACDFGPAEVIEHGKSGWIVPPEDVEAFGTAMDQLLDNPELLQRFREAGPPRAAEFDIDRMIEAYTDLFIESAQLRR